MKLRSALVQFSAIAVLGLIFVGLIAAAFVDPAAAPVTSARRTWNTPA